MTKLAKQHYFIFTFVFATISAYLFGGDSQQAGRPDSWLQWAGSFHLLLLHFPLALIMMTALSEIVSVFSAKKIFEDASRFMLISAALLAIPTVALGIIFRSTNHYSGLELDFIEAHMKCGIATAVLACITVYFRERYGLNALYYSSLFLLFLLVSATGFFGGGVSFGPYVLFPPNS